MNPEKARQVVDLYKGKLKEAGVPHEIRHDDTHVVDEKQTTLARAHVVLQHVEESLQKEETGKALQDLSLVQCLLWECGMFTFREIRDHNRSG